MTEIVRALQATAIFTALALAALSPATATPPAGKTYFTLLLGLRSEYGWKGECLRFTKRKVCVENGPCGRWEPTDEPGGFTFELELDEEEGTWILEGKARVERSGAGSSFGGTTLVTTGTDSLNVGLSGRAARKRECEQLAGAFNRRVGIPAQPAQASPCLERASFGPSAESDYVLPFPPRTAYHVNQTYCFFMGGHRQQLAYDFPMPIGDPVVAARAGIVREVKESSPDDGLGQGDHNYVLIEHADGSSAFYAHLQQDEVFVEPGQSVAQGELLANSGNSGLTGDGGPHLHFGVYRTYPPVHEDDLPINFRNAEGALDDRGGLVQNMVYTAHH